MKLLVGPGLRDPNGNEAHLGDYNLSLGQMLPIMCCFDYFFCDSKGVRIFRKLGFQNCEFLCLYGFDPELHRDYGLEKMWDVAFVGNLNHAIQQERESHLFRLARLADRRIGIASTSIRESSERNTQGFLIRLTLSSTFPSGMRPTCGFSRPWPAARW
ncbi:MAG: hypothetical protein JRJ83_10090 [Deltaproteobacteria bacterium]|nr:hypothetical protein [Deltaproteobacteria bacterium]